MSKQGVYCEAGEEKDRGVSYFLFIYVKSALLPTVLAFEHRNTLAMESRGNIY